MSVEYLQRAEWPTGRRPHERTNPLAAAKPAERLLMAVLLQAEADLGDRLILNALDAARFLLDEVGRLLVERYVAPSQRPVLMQRAEMTLGQPPPKDGKQNAYWERQRRPRCYRTPVRVMPSHWAVLRTLRVGGEMTTRQICDAAGLKMGATTTRLGELRAMRYVASRRDTAQHGAPYLYRLVRWPQEER